MTVQRSASLMDALSQYIVGLSAKEQANGQHELNRFVQWCGRDRQADELTPPEIEEYAGTSRLLGIDSTAKLKPVKSFLSFLKTKGITSISLAPHLKSPRAKRTARRVVSRSQVERASLTHEGYDNLKARLDMLKEERIKVVADIQRAMADKDFRENAPLDAAKERQGLIESSIRDLEGILPRAVFTDNSTVQDDRIRIGRKVTLRDTGSGKNIRYTLVDSRESDPVAGKISSVSPVGKALMDRVPGDEVAITVPKGTLHYVVEKVEN